MLTVSAGLGSRFREFRFRNFLLKKSSQQNNIELPKQPRRDNTQRILTMSTSQMRPASKPWEFWNDCAPNPESYLSFNPAMFEDKNAWSYRDLQILAGRLELGGKGKRVDIINRLTEWHTAQFDENRYIIGSNFSMLEVQLTDRQKNQLGPQLFSPLKKKNSQRYLKDGTPRSILSPRCRRPLTTGGKGKYNSRIKFSFNKTGAETEVRTKLSFGENCAENNGTPISSLSKLKLDSDDNNDNSQQSINKASRTSSACKENVNSNTGTTLAPFNDEEEAALKKEKKRIKFSVFNGVQIIPARKELKLQYALDQLREEEEGGEEDFDTELVNGSNYDHYNPETFEHEGEEDGEYSSDEDDNDAQRQQQEHEYGYDYGHEQDRENEEDDDEDAHVFVDNDDDLVEFYCDEDAEERDDGGDDDVFVHMDENETTGVEEEREEEEMIRGIVI